MIALNPLSKKDKPQARPFRPFAIFETFLFCSRTIGILSLVIIGPGCSLLAQSQDELPVEQKKVFTISLEYRPRTELRYGYRALPSDTSNVAFFTSHRARINLDFQRENFLFHTTLQDIRVWGDTDPRDGEGKAQFYEFYVEPSFNSHLSVRIGRQRIKYDNQRLFAENNWRQAGGQHDAVRFIYRNDRLETDLIAAFNQNQENLFNTPYQISWENYKVLIAHFIKYRINDFFTLTGINFTDGYSDPSTSDAVTYFKFTNGGRIAYNQENLYLTFAAYYQHGRIVSGESISAYYLEPEIQWQGNDNYQVRIGAQVFSGDNNLHDGTSHSFLAQYGGFHRFNGQMDYTQKTVRKYNHEGIINPYLIQDFNLSTTMSLSWESHLLGTQKKVKITEEDRVRSLDKLYAWENDFRFFYKPNDFTKVELAYMVMLPGKTLEYLPAGIDGSRKHLPQFAYLMVQWTPELFRYSY